MVGRVVGKRRKRPLQLSNLSSAAAGQWGVSVGPAALPSPAPTAASEPRSKRSCVSNEWSNLVRYDDETELDFSACDEQFLNLELCQQSELAQDEEPPYMMNMGLSTPSMSPPEFRFLSPIEPNNTSPSTRPTSIAPTSSQVSLVDCPSQRPAIDQQIIQPDDDETVCIKLLAHLKRLSTQEDHSYESMVYNVSKTTIVVNRLLRSSSVRADYTCHLLLTGIMTHLAAFCEQLLVLQDGRPSEEDLFTSSMLADSDAEVHQDRRQHSTHVGDTKLIAKDSVYESVLTCVSVGNLLKRKPLNGFQVLGRQESALVELERRMRIVLSSLS